MARVAHLFDQKQVGWKLVEGKRRFVISDDLVIKPASTANTVTSWQNTYILLEKSD